MLPTSIYAVLEPSTIEVIKYLDAGECELVDPDSAAARPVALTESRQLASEHIAHLAVLLLDLKSWDFARKRCPPRPDALFRLNGSKGLVTVLLGFTCDDWIITGPAAERKRGFFDPVQDQVREFLKSVFPEYASPQIRSLWRSGVIAELRRQREAECQAKSLKA